MKLCELLALITPDTRTIITTHRTGSLIPDNTAYRIRGGYMDMIVHSISTDANTDAIYIDILDPAEEANE